ncbi:hypothetical protein Micbo1qcDRAFT_209873 [Microdochium bolleyi]|uniref:Carboxylesterase type B domain-containing protein n=1 Tax=Microdochium bolleyi TaxID=196109 RepID=A0A136IKT3_9PEZI|nr:hypothetical protein Micbo1qcDRAFT_209873 [Microdochium bolleyi]
MTKTMHVLTSLALWAKLVSANAVPQSSETGSSFGNPTARCVAHVRKGQIVGHGTPQPSGDVCEWLSIPYAAAPVGDLRFAPPKASEAQGDLAAYDYVRTPLKKMCLVQ